MKYLLYLTFFFLAFVSNAQVTQKDILINEDVLEQSLVNLRGATSDELLSAYNDTFKLKLIKELEKSKAQFYPFEKLTTIGKITSQDKTVRIFSWNYQTESEKNIYTAIVYRYDKRKKKAIITELKKINLLFVQMKNLQ